MMGEQGHSQELNTTMAFVALGVRPCSLVMSAVSGSYSSYKLVWRILITLRDELLTL